MYMEVIGLGESEAELECTLVSYDASGPARAKAARVCQIVFGYEQNVSRNGITHTYRRRGYLDRPGARWIGQSVLMLRHEDARDLAAELVRLGVRVRMATVRLRVGDLAIFTKGG